MVRRESRSSTISHITLGTKQTGAPSAGNLHAGCDVAGAGNGFTVWLLRHSQRKRGATARLDLRNTAPVLAPTGQCSRMRMQLGFRLGLVCSSISATVSSFMVGKADALPFDKHRRDRSEERRVGKQGR